MRSRSSTFVSLILGLVLALSPVAALAFGRGGGGGHAGGGHAGGHVGGGRFGGRGRFGASPYYRGGGRGYYYGGRWYPYGHRYGYGYPWWGVGPLWWDYWNGWGVYPWGPYDYGYYPYWGAPAPEEAPPGKRPRHVSFALFGGGTFGVGPVQHFLPEGSLEFDSRRWGFNIYGAGLWNPAQSANQRGVSMPFMAAHLTYSFISTYHWRVRAELGGTGVIAPAVDYWGPDFGASAQVAVAGPLGFEARVHVTPWPAVIVDTGLDATLHFGVLGLKAGWRYIHLDDTGVNPYGKGGTLDYSGPDIGIGIVL